MLRWKNWGARDSAEFGFNFQVYGVPRHSVGCSDVTIIYIILNLNSITINIIFFKIWTSNSFEQLYRYVISIFFNCCNHNLWGTLN